MPHNCSKCGATCAGIPLVRPAPDPEIEALLSTNLPPSEAQEAFFRETQRASEPRLADLEARIADAQAKLDVLLQERDSLVWNMQRCNDVLNPVRRLPVDVLCEIFAHTMRVTKDSYSVPSEAYSWSQRLGVPYQWKLGMVCLNWRHVLLKYHRMWSKIDLTFSPSSDSTWNHRSQNDRPHLGAARLLAMHVCRSANHPLRVRLRGPIPQSFLFILISVSYRWEHLDLDKDNLLTVDPPLDALISFQCNLSEYGSTRMREEVPLLRNATSLRRIIVENVRPFLHPGRVIIPWTQINSVVVTGSLSIEDALALIRLAPNLGTVAFQHVKHSPLDPSHPVPNSVHSTSLKSFSLDVVFPRTCRTNTNYPSTITVLLNSLTLPALEHFRINFGGACGLSDSITRLVRRSRCSLKRLVLVQAPTDDCEGLLGADEFENLEEPLIEGLENVALLQSVLEILTELTALSRLRTVEIDASAMGDSIVNCQDAVVRFLESHRVENGGLESLTLRAPASFDISEVNAQRLEALRRLCTRFYIYRH
ncbi:uncharacterized protein BT62DRAFT_938138 [Guyanagaster necrorhizus]|uniref:F-box domain-containing protein n=1 Tax=Guyanagaster necrorhizus TaxID=856835 RepID=A0A9P7VGV6_9AGAR|nr:uncharacterized protein BT62DRAFT_938138 [Guyanagaster necrorhizus MCA 3950]KAG7440322.1 hypothetical protein BT62DRAFT_938138 [Guyanagaster necrorhizus MCA 3950]